MSRDDERVVGVPQLIWGIVKLAFGLVILATPLVGAWLSSSLAAYFNGSPRACLLAALLLFPVVPSVWEGIASARRNSARPRKSRLVDRLILRTLFLNVLFLGVLLWRFPAQAYVAASTRGDWFLEGHSGPGVDQLRSVLFESARGLAWLNRVAKPNPYVRKKEDDKPSVPAPAPAPERKHADDHTPPTPAPLTPTALWPQAAELHHAVREIPPSEETSIESVGLYLRAHSAGSTDRIKALHDWVADRIAYDVPALALPEIPDEDADAEGVFKRRLAVCAGYARLMRALGAVTGDQIEYVVGQARTELVDHDKHGGGHAWNAVYLDGRWQLLDATWDAGTGDDKGFHKQYTNDWLFTPPEVFGLRHHPDDSAWQLRATPIDRGAFMRLPLLDPGFYRNGFRLLDPDRSQVTVSGAFDAHVQRRDGQFLMASARPLLGGDEQRCEVNGQETLAVHCALLPGEYEVVLFDSPAQYGRYFGIGSFGVNVSTH